MKAKGARARILSNLAELKRKNSKFKTSDFTKPKLLLIETPKVSVQGKSKQKVKANLTKHSKGISKELRH